MVFGRVLVAAVWAPGVSAGVGVLISAAALLATAPVAPYPLLVWVPMQLVGVSFAVSGAIAWRRRPEHNAGRLMVATGLAWYVGDLQLSSDSWLFAIGFTLFYLPAALFAHLMITLLSGRLDRACDRWLSGALYGTAVGTQGMWLITAPGRPGAHMWGGLKYGSLWAVGGSVAGGALSVWAFVLVVARWRRAALPLRRSFAAFWAGGAAVGAAAVAAEVASLNGSPLIIQQVLLVVLAATMIFVPFAALTGVLWVRVSRLRVADLVLRLEASAEPGNVNNALMAALGDPKLRLCLYLDEAAGYVDTAGQPVDINNQATQAVTLIGDQDRPLAALFHDPILSEQRPLLDAVLAAARLALQNAQLLATRERQLADVRASRIRIVEAADEERRRIQRDLHDGAQHTLLSISMLIGQAVNDQSARRDALLVRAFGQMQSVVRELRELTEGIDPPALSEQGLRAVVETLAERAPLPVIFEVPDRRWPTPLERAAFFVINEALANIYKHANARSAHVLVTEADGIVLVRVTDDGVGGFHQDRAGGPSGYIGGSGGPTANSGIALRGLRDRVATVDGTLTVSTAEGGGLTVEAGLPCGS